MGEKYSSEIIIAERIKQLRLASGLSQKAFAESLGIVQGYLSSIERGRKIPSQTFLIALCHVCGVTEEWLFGEPGRKEGGVPLKKGSPASGGTGKIPLLKNIPQDFPDGVREEDISTHLSLPDTPEGCYAIIAEGDFMAPTIRDGDLVIFKPGGDIGNRSIVFLNNKWGEVILRRCRTRGGETYFSPENSTYSPFKLDADTRIFGTVANVWRKVKL